MLSPTTSAIYANKLLTELEALGLDAQKHRQNAGLSRAELDNPLHPIPMSDYLRLVASANEEPTAPSDLGFRVGEQTNTIEHGSMGYAILNSVDLRQCLNRLLKFLPLTGPVLDVSFELQHNHARLIATPIADYPLLTNRYLVQEWLANCCMWGSLIDRPKGLFVTANIGFASHGEDEMYAKHLGCPVQFGTAATEVYFPQAWLDEPINRSDTLVGELFERQCERMLQEQDPLSAPTTARVYRVLTERSAVLPKLDEMAQRLNLSSRTLKRRLTEERTSYQRLVVSFRIQLAKQYLVDTKLRIEDIADLVGYADFAHFYRTFRRVAGVTPARYRRMNL